MYDYRENVISDVSNAMYDYYSKNEVAELIEEDPESFKEELYDKLWTADSVTGNASGSYTFNTYKASENLVGNYDLLQEALEEFGYDSLPIDKVQPEFLDVTIRCYLLRTAIDEVIDNM